LGFIGTNLAIYFKKNNYTVRIIDNASKKGAINNFNLLKFYGITDIIISDIRHIDELKKYIVGSDFIFHLAGNCSTSRSIDKPIEDFKINGLGTLNLLYVASKHKIPLIYSSTCKVYSASSVNKTDGYIDESVSVIESARAPYGSSKLIGELYSQEFGELYDNNIIVDRLTSIFGLHQFGTEESGWVSWFCNAIFNDLPLTIYGDGKQIRDPLWVDDLCSLFEKQMNNIDEYSGNIYNIGGGKSNRVSLLEVIEYLEKITNKKANIKFERARPADLKVYYTNMNKIYQVSDWRPSTSVNKGIDKIISFLADSNVNELIKEEKT
tara:strand:+ start:6123 stop:7091 length:969 start_codon:yes stop_codon:yes gene_type:complete